MDILNTKVKKLYNSYLFPSLIAGMVISIYAFVDTIAVGQSEGPNGAAALAIINPLFSISSLIGMLFGVGGSVLYSQAKGEKDDKKGRLYFTASLWLFIGVMAICWLFVILFYREILYFFGGDENLMPLILEYGIWIVYSFPSFALSIYLSSLIRADGNPKLVMRAVVFGGLVNIFGDWFFVFPLKMGIEGAAIATVLGSLVQVLILISYFFHKKCHLRLTKLLNPLKDLSKTTIIGFSASIIELAFIVLSIMLNKQVMLYGDATTLAVFGVACTCSMMFQKLFTGASQAMQPIVAANFSASNQSRVKETFKLSMQTVIIMGIICTLLGILFPEAIIKLFIDVTQDVLNVGPSIIRIYFLSFLFMGVNILATFYLQSIMFTRLSNILALLRGLFISCLLLLILPHFIGVSGVWWAVVLTEVITVFITVAVLFGVMRTRKTVYGG